MPIYEFYCSNCHMLFDFYSARVDTSTQPKCPMCKKIKLSRRISSFSVLRKNTAEPGGFPADLDESKLEKAMASMSAEMDGFSEDDPVRSAEMMRKLAGLTGLELGSGMKEALKRLEAGEDPEKIEEEMGDLIEGEEPFVQPPGAGNSTRRYKTKYEAPPRKDDNLYEL